MTIEQVIAAVDAQRIGNPYMTDEKVKWLSDVEGVIWNEIVQTHENPDGYEFDGYTASTDGDTQLIAGDMYADLYMYYVLAQIDRSQQEYAKYNVDVSQYNALFQQFAAYYNRTHLPLQPNSINTGKGGCVLCSFH